MQLAHALGAPGVKETSPHTQCHCHQHCRRLGGRPEGRPLSSAYCSSCTCHLHAIAAIIICSSCRIYGHMPYSHACNAARIHSSCFRGNWTPPLTLRYCHHCETCPGDSPPSSACCSTFKCQAAQNPAVIIYAALCAPRYLILRWQTPVRAT